MQKDILEVGTIIPSTGTNGEEHYIVTEGGYRPKLEKVEDFIIRNYAVLDSETDRLMTNAEIILREKQKMLNRRNCNV